MFFEFTQNNSGGSFHADTKKGIGHYVIVEADSAEEANTRAEAIGVYFDGVRREMDCECCGDRWHIQYDNDGHEEPSHYSEVVMVVEQFCKNAIGFIHYKNGEIKGFREY